ncbi:16S rRNA (guanine(966)-N(2))-methyltransferase RsmD [Candidatus Planktophila versatilis]|uniref:16S rRNA (guanine(966)-N(2))-methyltransferase RsmD n=1 Tax=Candidatus Planktophila versatilis TaxID=1884905 RepID=UPI000BACA12C|nr:16S rRNA (guanine(966)-N(2))-methyltransferase RsmD [Candidatus Planktophila versatilis]ASY26538.1 16S rRNA (guanine966-N2)-methyltransferase [Candidatus Planktophila versatilis]
MRIIAGRAKGRNIDAVASATRPTSDRAREALFSTLASEFGDFDGLHVLDLYAGTGAIALEALSRGASVVHAVEKDEPAAQAIEKNYENIKSAQCPGMFHLYTMGVNRFLQDKAQLQYHFVYVDPPYDLDDLDVIETLIQLVSGGFLHPQALIAVERNSRVREISWPDGLEQVREKNYGQATIFYGSPTPVDAQNG